MQRTTKHPPVNPTNTRSQAERERTISNSSVIDQCWARSRTLVPAPAPPAVAVAVVSVVALLAALVATVAGVEGTAGRWTVEAGTPRHSGGEFDSHARAADHPEHKDQDRRSTLH